MNTNVDPLEKPTCHRCQSSGKAVLLRRNVTANGISLIYWHCAPCDGPAQKPVVWLNHAQVTAYLTRYNARYALADIPIVNDYRGTCPCALCGQPATEYHHWLPRVFAAHAEVAPEWSQWDAQGAYLCKYHHDLWHDLVTPYLPGRGQSRRMIANGRERSDLPHRHLTLRAE